MKTSVRRTVVGQFSTLLLGLSALVVATVGCRTKIGVLDSRGGMVPPPYMEPPPEAPPVAVAPLEAFPTPAPPAGDTPAVEPPAPPPPMPEELVTPPAPVTEKLTYKIKKGDTLWDIAQMYGVTYQNLAAENNISKEEETKLEVDRVLTIPAGGRFVPPEDRPMVTVTTKAAGGGTKKSSPKKMSKKRQPLPANGVYKVKKGDNLWDIGRMFGVKVSEIMEANKLDSDRLQIDQELIIPKPSGTKARMETKSVPKEVAPPAPKAATVTTPKVEDKPLPAPPPRVADETGTKEEEATATDDDKAPTVAPPAPPTENWPKKLPHTVCKGETLDSIAEMYGTTKAAILQENPQIKSDANLEVDSKILVPYK